MALKEMFVEEHGEVCGTVVDEGIGRCFGLISR
jgi:hypothetical protein